METPMKEANWLFNLSNIIELNMIKLAHFYFFDGTIGKLVGSLLVFEFSILALYFMKPLKEPALPCNYHKYIVIIRKLWCFICILRALTILDLVIEYESIAVVVMILITGFPCTTSLTLLSLAWLEAYIDFRVFAQ